MDLHATRASNSPFLLKWKTDASTITISTAAWLQFKFQVLTESGVLFSLWHDAHAMICRIACRLRLLKIIVNIN